MELEQQLAEIIKDAPDYGVPAVVIQKAIAPVLELFAQKLQHLEYFVLQNIQEDWVLTTIVNPNLSQEKKVVYAFVSVQDAITFQGKQSTDLPDLVAVAVPVVQLLFRLFSLQQLDSLIFLENSHNLSQGIEIKHTHLADAIASQIKQLSIPPNTA